MSDWTKGALVATGAGLLLVVGIGIAGSRLFERSADPPRAEAKDPSSRVGQLGSAGSLAACIEQAVQRGGICNGMSLGCLPAITSVLWNCFEPAPGRESSPGAIPEAEGEATRAVPPAPDVMSPKAQKLT